MKDDKVVTKENAEEGWGSIADPPAFDYFTKKGATKISTFTVQPGTPFETPEGLRAEDEECRIAFDSQGGVYPIRESVFRETYVKMEDPA
jgi:hypothetical protein